VASRPYHGHHHAVVSFNGELVVIGGFPSDNRPGGAVGSKVQVYNPTSNRWQTAWPDVPYGEYLGAVSAVVMHGAIRVCGGLNLHSNDYLRKNSRRCAKLDPVTQTWKRFTDMKVAVNHQAAGTNGEKLYIFGGRTKDSNFASNGISTVQIYDPATREWEIGKENMIFGRGGMGNAPFINGHFYIFGGEENRRTFSNDKKVFNQVHAFNPSTNTWTSSLPDMPHAVHGCYPVADVERGVILIAGGGDEKGLSATRFFQVLNVTSDI